MSPKESDLDPILLTNCVQVPEGVLIQEVAGEAVLLNLNNEQYYGLDTVGWRMWQVLTAADSIGAGIEGLLAEYDVERSTLEHDVLALLFDLRHQGLVEIRDAG